MEVVLVLSMNIKRYTISIFVVLAIAVMLALPACSTTDQERLKSEARMAVEESMAEMWEEEWKDQTP